MKQKRFPRGSEWRKWDLHVHTPGTKQNDGYGDLSWQDFCKMIHDSDVDAIGITDYFSLDAFFEFKKHYQDLYDDSEKVFFPNLELRLEKALSKSGECVNIHLLFQPDLKKSDADRFLARLDTEVHVKDGKPLTCADLKTSKHFESATVIEKSITQAIQSVFGDKAVRYDHVLVIASAGSDGIRSGGRSRQRKDNLADRVDDFCDGFFGNPSNREHFLKVDRLESDEPASPKPVFACCDAHSPADLEAWLGKHDSTPGREHHVTWIKADLTFEGLQQTLFEPSGRVRIQTSRPDHKEPYRVISRITFSDTRDFPDQVVFNPGLNAIIGSRSSGKSALLAYVSHAVDPDYTVEQQVAVGDKDSSEVGPGASITWADVDEIDYEVEWAAKSASAGRVVYIPQNSLFKISERPEDVTAKIKPVVFRRDPSFTRVFDKTAEAVAQHNESIRSAIANWFKLDKEAADLRAEARDVGDKAAIIEERDRLARDIENLSASSKLTENEVATYQGMLKSIGNHEARLEEIGAEEENLAPYVEKGSRGKGYVCTSGVVVDVETVPTPEEVSAGLRDRLQQLVGGAEKALLKGIKSELVAYSEAMEEERVRLLETIEKTRADNKDLIEKNEANTQLSGLIESHKEQEDAIAKIDKKLAAAKTKAGKQAELLTQIESDITARDTALADMIDGFNAQKLSFEGMTFAIEAGFEPALVQRVSEGFNKIESSPWVCRTSQPACVDLSGAQAQSGAFIADMGSGKQKLNRGENPVELATAVLNAPKQVRFAAFLEDDRIGGFIRSSMTQGKQALFALKLILAESDEQWPLLIDQPEDDLDSRSIYDLIVEDLKKRKCERQILMVSHDANLVIGADSEEIIVANRHGDDRPNRNKTMFAYMTGSLEHSKPKDKRTTTVLESVGIREHACEILDGGEEAFRKRKDKYNI